MLPYGQDERPILLTAQLEGGCNGGVWAATEMRCYDRKRLRHRGQEASAAKRANGAKDEGGGEKPGPATRAPKLESRTARWMMRTRRKWKKMKANGMGMCFVIFVTKPYQEGLGRRAAA